jgi:DtxR family Mn-dependent transcriptional regulator
MIHQEFLDQPREEVLETIWCMREEDGHVSLSALLRRNPEPATETIVKDLVARRLIEVSGDTIRLLADGEETAAAVVRRNRLAERLLSDVLDVSMEESEQQACLMEHVLSPAVTDAVCAFLGHPPTCPHGLPIPPGPCCGKRRNGTLRPVVIPLQDLSPGTAARITFIAPSVARRLDQLGSFGVVPGTVLTLRQKRPSLVVELGGTTLALEKDVAREIYVRPESS